MVNRKKPSTLEKDRKKSTEKSNGLNDDNSDVEDGDKGGGCEGEQLGGDDREAGAARPGQGSEEQRIQGGSTSGAGACTPGAVATPEGTRPPRPEPPQPHHQMATRSTTGRLCRKRKRDMSPPNSPAKKQDLKEGTSGTGTPETKPRKKWEVWSAEDRSMFFYALSEFGKDFESIQNLLCQKHKKRGNPSTMVKSKDQIRFFYYRTWHKLCKHINVCGIDDINKQALELYSLINYGELRKKVGGKIDDKIGQKLNALVHRGSTTIKVKGKTFRIKTPTCKALKKINQLDKPQGWDKWQPPNHVNIELCPHSNAAWARVQDCSQNPRLRLSVKPDRKVSSVIEFLHKKWKSHRVKAKEALDGVEEDPTQLRLVAPPGCKLVPLHIRALPAQTRPDLAFDAYIQNRINLIESGQLNSSPHNKKSSKNASHHSNHSAGSAGSRPGLPDDPANTSVASTGAKSNSSVQDCSITSTVEATKALEANAAEKGFCFELFGNGLLKNEKVVSDGTQKANSIGEIAAAATGVEGASGSKQDLPPVPGPSAVKEDLSETVGYQQDTSVVVEAPALDVKPSQVAAKSSGPEAEVPDQRVVLVAESKVEKMKNGVTAADGADLSVAEIYYMMGSPSKIVLEYEWIEKRPAETILSLSGNLTNMLRRLVHLATTEFTDFRKVKPTPLVTTAKSPPAKCCGCNCGRGDGTPPTLRGTKSPRVAGGNRNGRSPATPKTMVKLEDGSPLSSPSTPTTRRIPVASTDSPVSRRQAGYPLDGPMLMGGAGDAVFRVPTAAPPRATSRGVTIPIAALGLGDKNITNLKPEMFMPRKRGGHQLQRNVRKPMMMRTLLPKSAAVSPYVTLTMIPQNGSGGQVPSLVPVQTVTLPLSNAVATQLAVTPDTQPPTGAATHPESHPVPSDTMTNVGPLSNNNSFDQGSKEFAPHLSRSSSAPSLQSKSTRTSSGVRRIKPTPVTSSSETSIFTESPLMTSNILAEAALQADIPTDMTDTSSCSNFDAVNHITDGTMTRALTGVDAFLGNSMTRVSIRPASPPNISCLLGISTPSVNDVSESTDKLIDMTLCNSSASFSGLLENSQLSDARNNGSRPGTPVKTSFKGISTQITAESPNFFEDFSLGPLGDLLQESPLKKLSLSTSSSATTTTSAAEGGGQRIGKISQSSLVSTDTTSRDSFIIGKMDVDTTLQCMLNENSTDYMNKFANIAANMVASANKDPTQRFVK